MAIKVKNSKLKIQSLDKQKIKKFLSQSLQNFRSSKTFYLALLIVGLVLLFSYKKSWIAAAMVNNQLISNFEVLQQLNSQFRTQVLNQMINEQIIFQEAKKNGIGVNSQEVENKISALEKNVGGKDALDNLLAQQKQTRISLKDQLRLQLLIEKLYTKEATVSAEEITQFIEQNKDQLQATTSAEQLKEATDILSQQKLGKIFNEKFQELRKQANIKIF